MAKTKKSTSKITKSSPVKRVAKKPVAVKKPVTVKKSVPAKTTAKSKAVSKPAKMASKKPAAIKKPAAKPATKTVSKKAVAKSPAKPTPTKVNSENHKTSAPARSESPKLNDKITPVKNMELTPFFKKQREHLLTLRDTLLDSMNGVARDALRSRAEGSEASAFGMHQADAGSDAYDRDFALSLLSQEQDALYEIDEALKRLANGVYGICEISGKNLLHARLEAIPFARYTVECQSQIEKQNKTNRVRQPVSSLFGLTDDEGGDGDDDESHTEKE